MRGVSQPPISDYALIGNGQTAALVARDGSIDWCCWPRFDSPAVFSRLLDYRNGGQFSVAPAAPYQTERRYIDRTNVLQSTFTTRTGVVRLTDFMPAPKPEVEDPAFPHRILRHVECLEGRNAVDITFAPRFEYGRVAPEFQPRESGVIAHGHEEALSLSGLRPEPATGAGIHRRMDLTAGDSSWFVLTHGPPCQAGQALRVGAAEAAREYARTIEYWQRWSNLCQYDGPYRELVLRSALTLKLLVFQPTGGLVAAPTTSLPAELGGVRNWDYRYTWLRDSGLVLDALQQLGYHRESMRFIDWLENLCLRCEGDLRVLYSVDGSTAPGEEILPHLSGYHGSSPVRIGNGAVEQTQIDSHGHIVDALVLCYERTGRAIDDDVWAFLRALVDRIATGWTKPDQGPWEMRGPAQQFVNSKLYCWVGLDRAIRFAERRGLTGELDHWRKQRDRVREEILARGFDPNIQSFTQAFDSSTLDANALTLPLVGFLPAGDRRVQSTLRRVEERLSSHGLVYRYRVDDGLPGGDNTFTLCGFWWVMNLALSGRRQEATRLFERICGCANDVGLLSEQIDSSNDELRGNFPQGFTHLGLIRAALHLRDSQFSEGHE